MKVLILIVFYSIALVLPSVSKAEPNETDKAREERDRYVLSHLGKYAHANPEKDFETARRKGDLRFVGMMGYGLSVPGVPDYEKTYAKSVGVKIIPGTTDAITSQKQSQLEEAVRLYAKRYNQLLLQYLAKHPQKAKHESNQ